ncbi:hypothetical protein KAFR_0H01990 [Kazachstania africana CBS 2517]|uniref:PRELI/MSF1 domain-containing protein n=1 Tax=Kazachstania africana (strain ATCC 22294 / BCRC 22015 / CBS 2517 / CECT 1963 / NBRC 1671 / NRRL Y-8276) TaxID=1071382 RepID=H2AZ52_KAZAF|nr:hypothetical protein KAFR_0H01990 [Kazachstania africana CBS 2517]CCF59608.1 hypothetical protein KAFR_0H01990 [Kazachstania africana CBS 2517]
MKLFNNSYELDYPWNQVTAANWNKYPNEVSTHVVAVDVLRREVKDSGNVLVTERLITVQQNIPRWLIFLLGSTQNVSYVREVSTVNLQDKTLTLKSCNLNYVNLLKVFETVQYTPHPKDPLDRTLFKQEAQISACTGCNVSKKLTNTMEDWSIKRFCDNAKKGKIGFNSVLRLSNEETSNYK